MGSESFTAQGGTAQSVLAQVEALFNRLNARSRTVKLAILINVCLIVLLMGYLQYPGSGDMYLTSALKGEPAAAKRPSDVFPKNIWQVYLSPPGHPRPIDPKKIPEVVTWVARNPDYKYDLIGDAEMLAFLGEHWNKTHPVLWDIFTQMSHPSMRSDLVRYLVLATHGGVYSDTDVEAIKPIDEWVPAEFRDRAPRVVVGIEFDRLGGPNWGDVHEDIQFVLWTVMAAKGHPLLARMVDKAVGALRSHLAANNMTWSDMKVTASEVMKLTGPGIWTDGVIEHILESHPGFKATDLSGLTSPVMIDDILILPIDALGMGQPHSNSTNDGTIPADALVRHKFAGSWRTDKSMVGHRRL